jgi:hypothetical protein
MTITTNRSNGSLTLVLAQCADCPRNRKDRLRLSDRGNSVPTSYHPLCEGCMSTIAMDDNDRVAVYRPSVWCTSPTIEDGYLTVEQCARSFLLCIAARDATLIAWASLRHGLILERARELDQTPPGKRGPLHECRVSTKTAFVLRARWSSTLASWRIYH